MDNGKLIMKCCICGRIKTEHGWDYEYGGRQDGNLCSHGFCSVCYETEIRKMRMQVVLPQIALSR